MIKFKEEEKIHLTWNDVANESLILNDKTPSLTSRDWLKWKNCQLKKYSANVVPVKLADHLVHLSSEQIKKTDMIDKFNDTRMEPPRKLDEGKHDEYECRLTVMKVPQRKKPEYTSPCMNLISLDPNHTINVTASIRGNITAFSTLDRDRKGKINEIYNEGEEIDAILENDVVICDATKNRKTFLRVWNFIRKVSKLYEEEKMNEDNIELGFPEIDDDIASTKNIKTIILISSLLTSANTPELTANPEYSLQEYCYLLRICHDSYKAMYMLENALLKLGAEYHDKVRVLIIGTGIIYGPRESALSYLLEMTYQSKVEFPIFGTGQNVIPVIHIEDLIRLINTVINNFPENHEYIFAVESERITQSQLINILCKSNGNTSHSRFVSKNNCLLFDISEDDAYILSANLPVESSYQKIVNFNFIQQMTYSIPPIIRRYFSLIRNFKAPCCIIAGPPCHRVNDIAKKVSIRLGTENLTPQNMIQTYIAHLGNREIGQKLVTVIDKYVNDLTAMPRGKALIRVLNRAFMHPRVQKNGYVLSRFPESFKEAVLLDKILESITDSDATYFPDYKLENSLKPDTLIILLMDEKELMKEISYRVDVNGASAAEILKNLTNFRMKLGDKNFFLEFYENLELHPLIFNIGEYGTNQDCANAISDLICTSMKCSNIEDIPEEEVISIPTLLNKMSNKEEKQIDVKSCDINEEDTMVELYIELGTRWNSEGEISKVQDTNVQSGSETRNEILEICQVPPKLAVTQDLSQGKEGILDKVFFESATIHDKIKKPMKDLEGIVSRCCLKNMRPPKKIFKPTGLTSSSNISPYSVKKSVGKRSKPHKNKISLKDEIYPKIKWSAGEDKAVKGDIIGWCKEKVLSKESLPEVPSSDSQKQQTTDSCGAILKSPSFKDLDAEGSSSNSIDLPLPKKDTYELFTNIDPKLIRSCALFRYEDIELYKNWNMFFDLSTFEFEFRKYEDEEDYSFHKIIQSEKDGIFTDNIIRNVCKKDGNDDVNNDLGPDIKLGEKVQLLHKCCSNNDFAQGGMHLPYDPQISYPYIPSKISASKSEIASSQLSSEEALAKEGSEIHSLYDYSRMSDGSPMPIEASEIYDGIEMDYLSEGSHNLEFKSYCTLKRASAASNASSKSILKIKLPITKSWSKKSLTQIGRKVTFSSGDTRCEVMKSFDEKFEIWLDAHRAELKNSECLRMHDYCSIKDGNEKCSVYLYKDILARVSMDWRNDNLTSLFDPFSPKLKIVNYSEMQDYFTKYWPHFRVNLPYLTLLPTSVMLQIERNFVCESVRCYQRKSIDYTCEEIARRDDSCVCNKVSHIDDVIKYQRRDTLESPSIINIVYDEKPKKSTLDNAELVPAVEDRAVVYNECKKASSWISCEDSDLHLNNLESNESLTPFWTDEQ